MTTRTAPAVGAIVALDHLPRNVGGRGWTNLRYRVDCIDADGSVRVFGPLIEVDGRWIANPSRRPAYRNVNPDSIVGAAA